MHEQDGSPVRDALVLAKLTAVERYNGYVVADEYTGRTDERGRAVVAVFPNELGSEGSEYRFRIVTPAGKTFSVYATVPNSDCNLHQICELEPSERRGAGQVVSTEMAGYVTQAETARDKSQEAANRAQAAAVQVDVSAQTATAAASQALSNANAAKRAAEDATGLVQRTETAVAGFESEVIGRVEAETQRLGGEASTAFSTAKDQAMTALDAHMEQKTEGLDLHAADLKAALTASLGTREEEAIGAVRIERDAALVVLREEGAQFREDLNTLAERSEDAAKRAACSAAITVKAASDVDEALTDTAIDLLAPQVVAEAVRQATEIALDSANTATVEAEKSRQSAATACACADESAASAQGAADSAAAAETSAGAAADSASVAAASEAVATAKAGEASTSATAAKASENAAKASEQTATEAANTATMKAGEASVSAAAADVSETNAASSATAAADSANVASAAQTAAEAACEETKKVAVLPATTTSRGSVMPDGLTISVTADGTISAKDVAIGGNLEDLASARGQVGPARELGSNVDYNTVTEAGFYLINATGGVNGPIVGSAAFLQVFYSKKEAFTKNLYQIVYAYSSARERMFLRQYRIASNDWSSWSEIVSSSCIGDGLTVNNGIISVPEYEGATASAAGTSGLVPPAAAGQQESFLTGGGEYKPALSTSGGVMTGSIQINDLENAIEAAPSANTERGLFLGDKNSVIMGGFDIIQHASDNAKRTQMFAKNASGAIASIAAVTHEDGTREISTDCPMRLSDVQIERLFADSVRLIKFSGAHGNEGLAMRYSPDSGELYLDGRAVHGKADSAGYADTAGSANALGGKAESALSVAFASEAQNAFGLKGMDMIIVKTTHTLPNYGTWKYMYLVATDEKWIDMVIGENAGGTTLTPNYPGYPDAFMDGMAFRSA
ncbi:pyocin knob domain-containing protein [Bilophila wadsworthia]|uniref:pyocin knob domain-containing protein n=1 Tax=Bilophila wadsworthia TaxID=35833 RepID=UPI003AEFC971